MEISTFCVFKFLSFACFVEKKQGCVQKVKPNFTKNHFLLATSKKFHSSILKRKPVSAYVFIVEHIFDHFFSPAAPPTEFVTEVIFVVLAYFEDFSGRLMVNQVSDTNSSRHPWFILFRCLFLRQQDPLVEVCSERLWPRGHSHDRYPLMDRTVA